MANPFDQFDTAQANPFDQFDEVAAAPKGAVSIPQSLWEGTKGAAAFAGDIASGFVKIPVQSAAAVIGKVARPDLSLQELYQSAGESIEGYTPSFGSQLSETARKPYETGMVPFEKLTQGINYAARKAGELTGSKDVEGAVNVAAPLLPIPFLGKVAKGVGKVIERVDPGLRNVKAPERAPSRGDIDALKEQMKPKANPFDQFDTQMDLELVNTPEQIAEMRAAQTGQGDLFNQGYDPVRARQVEAQATANEQRRYSAADEAMAQRQAAMEQQVAQQTGLDLNAAQRRRFEQQPTGYAEWLAEQQRQKDAVEAARNTQFREQAGQMEIDATPHVLPDTNQVMADQYGAMQGVGRFDENGMPIRADLSMEAQNLQNPLQRNLWGDELGPGQGAQRSLTGALDTMPQTPWVGPRDEAISQLSGQPHPQARVPKSQRGAINMEVFDPAFNEIKELANGIRLWMIGDAQGPMIRALDPNGKEVGNAQFRATPSGLEIHPSDNLTASWVDTEGAPKQGLAQEMYRFASEMGNDIVPSSVQTPAGKEMWKGFEKSHLADQMKIPRGQRGAVDFTAVSDAIKRLATIGRNDPAVQAGAAHNAAADRAAALGNIPGFGKSVENLRPKYSTPESVIAAAPSTKDIGPIRKVYAETIQPGIRKLRLKTDNPLAGFINLRERQARMDAEALSKQYITNKQDSFQSYYNKLTPEERVRVHEAWMEGSKNKHYITREQMENAGYNERQIQLMEHIYKMDRVKLDEWNDARLSLGLEPVKELPGHAPGVFTGDYHAFALDSEGRIKGRISADTEWQFNAALKEMKKQQPDLTFTEMQRNKLGGHGVRGDFASGAKDLLALLAKEDPKFAAIQSAIDMSVANNANAVYQAHLHGLEKKGIWGAEGLKPWKDAAKNADEAFKSYLRYWEDGMLSHKYMPMIAETKSLMENPALDHMPRMKEYATEYLQGITGHLVGWPGEMFNAAIDGVSKNIGISPKYAKEAFNQLNKRFGQHTMGWFNMGFTGAQFLQLAQTAFPEIPKFALDAGVNPATVVPKAIAQASADGIKLFSDRLMGKTTNDPFQKAMYDFAEHNGLLRFSEFEDVNAVTKGKVSKRYDQVADFTRSASEIGTRPYVFFTLARILEESGVPKHEIFDIAYEKTQDVMYDYSAAERPLGIKKLGVASTPMGALSTFKLNYLDQMGRWNKEALLNGNILPWIGGMTAAMALYGVTGLPGYQEADEATKYFTGAYSTKGQRSIAELALENWETGKKYADQLQYGALSTASGINWTTRLGAADVLPNSPLEALSPFGKTALRLGQAGYTAATEQDPSAINDLVKQAVPSSVRGLVENKLLTTILPDYTKPGQTVNMTTNKKGQAEYARTAEDMAARAWGLTTLNETKNKLATQRGVEMTKADSQYRKDVEAKMERMVLNAAPLGATSEGIKQRMQLVTKSQNWRELAQSYVNRGGTTEELISFLEKALPESRMTSKQRMQGIPGDDLRSLHKYQNFNQ